MNIENISTSFAASATNLNHTGTLVRDANRSPFANLMADVQAKNVSASQSTVENSQKSAAARASQSSFRNSVVNAANASNQDGEVILDGYLSISGPLIDISDLPTIRYSHNGEVVTPESEAYYNSINQSRLQSRQQIVNAEHAKGSSTAEILGKILDFDQTMPDRFKALDGITT